ncbi:MAG: glycine cleavage system aminomethyltransferase GcvT [Thaumarchaeota archaeon]|nr:glycine cleavage system aminomethyltransferase GcvT [Nitrososphaerota archaeon]
MLKTTQLHDYHSNHAKMTEFAGYDMPLWYTTTTEEHLAVREGAGIFDVSHMGRFTVKGKQAASFIEGLVPTGVGQQPPGKAFYTLLLDEQAGIIDDLIIMRLGQDDFVLVVNAANAETDMRHIQATGIPAGVEVGDMTATSVMIAVQGPKAQEALQPLTDLDLSQLKRFRCAETRLFGERALVSRTGYTGEDGFEATIIGPTVEAPGKALEAWEKLASSARPCGLGARDSLRLEAGFPLHGSDIDQKTDPFQADLAWVISAKSGYVGSAKVAELRTRPPEFVRRGVVLESGIPRHGFDVLGPEGPVGKVTSGTFSPILRRGIALCSVRQESSEIGSGVKVTIRESVQAGHIVKPPFYDEQLYGWKRRRNGN